MKTDAELWNMSKKYAKGLYQESVFQYDNCVVDFLAGLKAGREMGRREGRKDFRLGLKAIRKLAEIWCSTDKVSERLGKECRKFLSCDPLLAGKDKSYE